MVPNVLVVEPYADLRSGIVSALQRLHFDCDAVESTGDARLKLLDRDYEYVIVDVDSPSRSDSEGLVDSLALGTNIIVIDEIDAELIGANPTLRKPFGQDDLRRIMRIRA